MAERGAAAVGLTSVRTDDGVAVVRDLAEAGRLCSWLEANGVDPYPVVVDQVIDATGGRIRLVAVDLDERGCARLDVSGGPTDGSGSLATVRVDVPLVHPLGRFGQ